MGLQQKIEQKLHNNYTIKNETGEKGIDIVLELKQGSELRHILYKEISQPFPCIKELKASKYGSHQQQSVWKSSEDACEDMNFTITKEGNEYHATAEKKTK